ncbi:MAG: methylenetetrahydrofolate reductase [NAD(P)H] [Methylocystaceae bacterium]|nr:MAG: methylenetetrahydrofolate reductase [NAD(P)H] [Methylocystaceae bacterium]
MLDAAQKTSWPPGLFDISYEFFPPKTPEMETQLWESIERLAPLRPRFVSVTYGAGGSTRERTHNIVARLVAETDILPAAHLTCVSASRDEVDDIVRGYWSAGVRHIVALRGDPPGGVGSSFEPHPEGYRTSTELVRGIRRIGDFEISVSTYPEGHPESSSIEDDLDALESKIDAGATRAITQFFFENDVYFRFLDKARARGIKIPIVPGIMPVQNFKQTASFARKAGASVPAWLAHRFEGLDEDPVTRRLIAAAVAAEQVLGLAEAGVREFHFYTNNRADLVFAICHLLGVRPFSEKVAA